MPNLTALFSLSGKTALVTGAASGIGEAIAIRFAAAGACVVVTDVNDDAGVDVVSRIKADDGDAEFLHLDVGDESSWDATAERVLSRHRRLDLLVNNAGIGHVGAALTTTVEDLDRLYRVNVRGMFGLTKAFLPSMIASGGGNIINLSSVSGIVAVRDRLAYNVTKFAVVGLTKSIALDHATDGIRANCICPGRVETPFVQARIREYPDPEKAYREMSATQAVGRMGRPEEIAAAAHYLASDEATFITGTTLIIDGGWTAGK